jgi:hypothetical protein
MGTRLREGGMSGSSDYTQTPNLGLFKPTFNADVSNWGQHWNQNADTLDGAFPHGPSGSYLLLSGGTLTGPLTLSGDASAALNPVTLQQLNTKAGAYLPLTGGSLSGTLTAPQHRAPLTNTNFTTAIASDWFYANAPMVGSTTENNTAFNSIIINDSVSSTAPTTPLIAAFKVLDQSALTTLRGSRIAIYGVMRIPATTANNGANPSAFYVAVQGDASASVADGGTAGNAIGAIDGAFFGATLSGTATNYASLYGVELSTGISAGCSAQFRAGLSIEEAGGTTQRAFGGYGGDNAIQILNGGGSQAGYGIGLAFGHAAHPAAFKSDSAYIASVPITANNNFGPLLADVGLRFWQTLFTTNAMELPGLTIGPTGNVALANATLARTATGVALDVPNVVVTGGTIAAAGTAYTANDLVYEATSKSMFLVSSVDGSGHITGLSLRVGGALATAPGGPLALTGGSGDHLATVTLTTAANKTLSLNPSGGALVLPLLTNAANDAAAASAGVAVNQLYRNGSVVMQRVA